MIKTGIFGGSFNPIHNGHISLARQLREKAELDEVWLMVSPQNPLKQQADLLDDRLRMEMARRALEGVEGVIASDYEMYLPRPSYTWNTLQALSRDYPDREFVLLMGGDNLALFHRWYHYEDILRNYRIVVYPRTMTHGVRHAVSPGDDTACLTPCVIEAELMDISSTEIRRRIKAGESISGMVPQAVEDFIRKEGLYA
jgi:nicotinate-nucleotide adenylyltransferase